MALKIFDADPDAKPKANDDIVGRFRSGAQVNGRPLALDSWRITTGDPEVADAVADLYGGSAAEWETQTEERLEVYTDATAVNVVLDGPQSVRSSMVLWGRNGKIRECDGVQQAPGADGKPGGPCVCPQTVKERKEAAKAGHGCEPSVQIYFALEDHPELGRFKFFSGSWTLAADIGKAEEALARIDGPARGELSLERVAYTTKQGRDVSFTKPVLKVLGPVA